ncbi:MAG: porin [Pseudomonadales bacterium]|nr:porin [Pseudomonadales bacterium]
MKTKLLTLATGGLLAASTFTHAADVAVEEIVESLEVSGFIDIIYTGIDEAADGTGASGKNPNEQKFGADGEVDITGAYDKVSVRIDVDVRAGSSDSGDLEQAFFVAGLTDQYAIVGGVFNNPIGWEAHDAPDMYQTSHAYNWDILDGATALYGNNVAGVAVAADWGMFYATGAVLNDLAQTDEENSLAVVLGLKPIDGLDIELGVVTQADKDNAGNATAGNVTDLNATWVIADLTLAAEILLADAIVDDSTLLLANYAFGGGFGLTGRYEVINFASNEDLTRMTVAGSWQAAKNLAVLAELSDSDSSNAGDPDGKVLTLEFVGTF